VRSAHSRRAVALGTSTIAALLVTGTAALPAQAAGSQLQLFPPSSVQLPLTAPANPSSDPNSLVSLRYGRTGSGTVHQVQLTFDASALAGIADFHYQGNCTTKGTVFTCAEDDLHLDSINATQTFWLTAAPGVRPGTSGKLHVSLTSSDAASTSSDIKVSVGGPDLRIKDPDQVRHAKPGGTVQEALEVANLGQLPTDKLVVEVLAVQGLQLNQRAANCEYADIKASVYTGPGAPQFKNTPARTEAICTVNAAVAPGEVYRIDPVQLGISSDAYASILHLGVFSSEDAPYAQSSLWRAHDHFTRGTGTPLTAARTTDPALLSAPRHTYDNQAQTEVTADNTADFSALGSWAPQDGGKQGTLSVGLHNAGPASIIFGGSGEDPADVRLQLPQGVTVTKAPDGCRLPDKAKPLMYDCATSYMIVKDYSLGYDFGLSVNDPAAAPHAQIDLVLDTDFNNPKPATLAFDPNPANNAISIALGAQPVGNPIPSPSASATGTPGTGTGTGSGSTPGAGSTATATATPAGSSAKGLAFTGGGSDAAPIAAVGGGAVLIGAGALFYARRRKAATRS
jgi:hypothetical protein